MTNDTEPAFTVFRCPACNRPTKETLDRCRHCSVPLKADSGLSPSAGFPERVFGINTSAGRLGCLGAVAALVAIPALGISYCSQVMNEKAAADARAATEQKAKEDQEADAAYASSVADGSVCVDRLDGSNAALVDVVKTRLRDPDSFEHVKTVIGRRNAEGQYPTLMQYRAKNGFGGYTVGLVHARLELVGRRECNVATAASIVDR